MRLFYLLSREDRKEHRETWLPTLKPGSDALLPCPTLQGLSGGPSHPSAEFKVLPYIQPSWRRHTG